MKKIYVSVLLILLFVSSVLTARDILIAEFMKDHIGLILGTSDYHIYNFWEEKGSKSIEERDRSGRTGSKIRKSFEIKDVFEIEPNIIKLSYESVNGATERVTLETEYELGDILLDEFIRTGAKYTPRIQDEGNIVFSGTYYFDDYIITVTEYKKEQKLSFGISMTSQFANKNIRRR